MPSLPKPLIATPAQFALEQKWAADPNGTRLTPANSYDPSYYPVLQSSQPTPDQANPLYPLIRRQVRERWTALLQQGMTPDRVEQILRGAFTGQLLYQWELFDLMEDTWPRLKKCLNELKRAVQKVDYTVVPFCLGKKPSDRANQKKQRVELALASFRPSQTADENGRNDMIYDLCDAIGKGISVQEVIWEPRQTLAGPAVLARCTRWVHPIHYGYRTGEIGLKLCPDGMGGTWIDFPEHKFLIGMSKSKSGHPIGGGLLRCLAAFWIASNFSWDWMLNLAQMFGIPIRWATYDPTKQHLVDDISDMLEQMGSAGWGAFPAGTTLELKEAVQRAADNPQAYILDIADVMCDILILGQTLTTAVGNSGSRALGEVHAGVRQDIIEYYGTWVAETLSLQFVPALMMLNFGDNEEDPQLVAAIKAPQDGKAMAERDQILIQSLGLPVPRAWLYDRHDIPQPEEGDDVFEAARPTSPFDPAQGGFGGDQEPTLHAKAADGPRPQSAQDKLVDNVLERVTGVEAKWLAGVKPIFENLIQLAQSEHVSDAELLRAIERAGDTMPELFPKMRTDELAKALENAMSAALVNGVSKGVMLRGKGGRR